MLSSCPIPKGNALPAQMCGQGAVLFLEEIDLWKSDLLLLTARLRGVLLRLRMACGASLIGAVGVVAFTLAG